MINIGSFIKNKISRGKMRELLKWFYSISLKYKIFLTYLISISVIGVIGYSYYIYNNMAAYQSEASIYRQKLINNKKAIVENMVGIATKTAIAFYNDYKNGEMTEREAQIKTIEYISSIQYKIQQGSSEYGYIWINTTDGNMVSDPAKPELNGTYVWNFKDKNGVYLFREMSRVVKTSGSGFVNYCWAKPGQSKDRCFSKISYISCFCPWKWIIGSGFYTDDIDKDVSAYVLRAKHNLTKTMLYSVALGGFATLISIVIFFVILSRITSYISKIAELSKRLITEDISSGLKLPVIFSDELGNLVKNFNAFIDESYKLFLFKKMVEGDKDIDAVYNRVANLLKEEFSINHFTIYEVNNSKNALKQIETVGSEDMLCKRDILLDSSLCRAVRTAHDVYSSEGTDVCLSYIGDKSKSYICIPLVVGGTIGSVIQMIFDENADMQKEKINRLKKFLKEAAPVIESKRLLSQLKESTLRDPLTGIYNRRFLDEFASTFAASIKRRGTQCGILMCDIDFFKKVNDTYGHNVGDEVLKSVVGAIMKEVRESDMFVRFGGEEFLILLMDTDEKDAMAIAERIRKSVESTSINVGSSVIKKTISIGISLFDNDSENLWQCIKYSDVAMYKAKETGRNRVVRFEPSMWENEEY